MRARLPGALAMAGGAAWAVWPIPTVVLHLLAPWTDYGASAVMAACLIGGTVVLALATIALVAAAHDVLSPLTAVIGILGALGGTMVLFGAEGGWIALLFSSVLVVWRLGRVGALGVWLSRVHAAAALGTAVGYGIGPVGASPIQIAAGITLLVSVLAYAGTWLVIGWSLLRTTAVAPNGTVGASPA